MKCPSCHSEVVVKNGFRSNDKQNYKCLNCARQFVDQPENKIISIENKERIRKTLLERVSLEGICRIFDVSMTWLLNFITKIINELPQDLNAVIIEEGDEVQVSALELDELHSYVGNKKNAQWLWLAMHSKTRQVLAFHVGKRTKQAAEHLWAKIPEELKKKAQFYTDKFAAYFEVIPFMQHKPCNKGSGKTNYIERFNCTLRQRIPRLVRKTLSYSKKLFNHIGIIKHFICDYNNCLLSSCL